MFKAFEFYAVMHTRSFFAGKKKRNKIARWLVWINKTTINPSIHPSISCMSINNTRARNMCRTQQLYYTLLLCTNGFCEQFLFLARTRWIFFFKSKTFFLLTSSLFDPKAENFFAAAWKFINENDFRALFTFHHHHQARIRWGRSEEVSWASAQPEIENTQTRRRIDEFFSPLHEKISKAW